MKKIISLFLSFLFLFNCFNMMCFGAKKNYSLSELKSIAEATVNFKKKEMGVKDNQSIFTGDFLSLAGSTSADWYVIAMSRLGLRDDYPVFLSALENNVEERYKNDEKLSLSKSTEWHRISLAISCCSGNCLSVGKSKINLISDGIYFREKLGKQGINGYIWGLIALDSMNYNVPENCINSRRDIIDNILSSQTDKGGFTLNGENEDVDITAMAVQSLCPYYDDKAIKNAVDKALSYLSEVQLPDGSFESFGTENAESISQVIIALCSMGLDPATDLRFIKNGNSVVDALMKFKNKDGGFSHTLNGKSNSMAGEQSLLALASLIRFYEGKTRLYDFSDMKNITEKSTVSHKKISESETVTEKNISSVKKEKAITEAKNKTKKSDVNSVENIDENTIRNAKIISDKREKNIAIFIIIIIVSALTISIIRRIKCRKNREGEDLS